MITVCIVFFTAGCAQTAKIKKPFLKKEPIKKIEEMEPLFTVGERFTYIIAWKGIHVGTATAMIEKIMTFKGHKVYKIVVKARTNDFLDKLYKVDDTFISYMDKDLLISRHYEAIRSEGNYRKDLVVDYDFTNNLAIYKNLRDGSVKTAPIKEDVQDPISAAYLFRIAPAEVGKNITITVNLNEKNYYIAADIEKIVKITVPELGAWDAFLVKPRIKLENERFKKAKAWGYISSDKKRLGLYIILDVLSIPWVGRITATLKKIEYVKETGKID